MVQCRSISIVFNSNRTYEHYDDEVNQNNVKVWIAQSGAGLEKRQKSALYSEGKDLLRKIRD